MKIENIIIDSKVDFFNAKIIGIVGSVGCGKTSLMKHLYNFYNGLRFDIMYENKETGECHSNERKHSEFEYSNKKVMMFDGFYENPMKGDGGFMNMIRNKSHQSNVHKIFLTGQTYSSPRFIHEEEVEEEEMMANGVYRRTRRIITETDNIKGGKELLYMSDMMLKVVKQEDGLYQIVIIKSRNKQDFSPNTPFFRTLANEYSKYPVYPNRFLREHLMKYDKFDTSILPMDNFKDIFNI